MKILITGGAGYIGFALAETLASNPEVDKIILYDNLSRHNESVFIGKIGNPEKLKLISADILDSRKLRKCLDGVDVVYHLAAKVITPFANQDPHFFEQINHWGTAELVYALEESAAERLIYVSSASVYGRTEEADESTTPDPGTYYGISKLRGEEHVERLKSKMKVQIIRCGNVYGYAKAIRFDAVINHMMMQANFENKISIHGSGEQSRAFVHVETAAEVLSKIPFSEIPTGNYNLVTKNLAVNDIAATILDLYPSCERIFINQHLKLGSISVSTETKIKNYISINDRPLANELSDFKNKFAFTAG